MRFRIRSHFDPSPYRGAPRPCVVEFLPLDEETKALETDYKSAYGEEMKESSYDGQRQAKLMLLGKIMEVTLRKEYKGKHDLNQLELE